MYLARRSALALFLIVNESNTLTSCVISFSGTALQWILWEVRGFFDGEAPLLQLVLCFFCSVNESNTSSFRTSWSSVIFLCDDVAVNSFRSSSSCVEFLAVKLLCCSFSCCVRVEYVQFFGRGASWFSFVWRRCSQFISKFELECRAFGGEPPLFLFFNIAAAQDALPVCTYHSRRLVPLPSPSFEFLVRAVHAEAHLGLRLGNLHRVIDREFASARSKAELEKAREHTRGPARGSFPSFAALPLADCEEPAKRNKSVAERGELLRRGRRSSSATSPYYHVSHFRYRKDRIPQRLACFLFKNQFPCCWFLSSQLMLRSPHNRNAVVQCSERMATMKMATGTGGSFAAAPGGRAAMFRMLKTGQSPTRIFS